MQFSVFPFQEELLSDDRRLDLQETDMQEFIQLLKSRITSGNILEREPMSRHTTFSVGGPADIFVQPGSVEEVQWALQCSRERKVPFFVVGNGSNLLVSDEGYRGVILRVGNGMREIRIAGNHIVAQAGATLAGVARAAMEHGLTGMEFASGIPGTVGGGVVMNAGAYGGEMSQVVKSVEVLGRSGEFWTLDNETMEFGYRKSSIKGHEYIVTEVEFELTPGDQEKIKATMAELALKRREKQPLEYPSAGSTFKRPEGLFAGKLIQDAGLRGYRVGGAQVSEKHCGFVVNVVPGETKAGDVMQVIRYCQEQVKEAFDVKLEPEVIFLGDF